ncbi:MAG: ATP-binding cassette domain-containing protein [Breznakia sp.]
MLNLKNIRKSYKTGDFVQHALKGIHLHFRKSEFVAVLGQSGSGKTTLLNIIGGLDHYDEGDLIINEKSTKKFKQRNWDAYRNNCIGFVFQNYNLIGHIDILANVEMGMTLSGVSMLRRRDKALEVLERVGLEEHAHKKPNQLSGGQMQRVAIARALANDPDIILADEPTGALDSETSVQIMDLIKDIAKDKLVIMVTHNPDLAHQYANRIIELKDGEVIADTNPVKKNEEKNTPFHIVKTAMSYVAALKLSFNNIRTKKGRTIITSFASSIGIIGIALILALSNGFQKEIDTFERDSLSQMPITIDSIAMQTDPNEMLNTEPPALKKYSQEKLVAAQKDVNEVMYHKNNITQAYVDYLHNIDKKYISGFTYTQGISLNALIQNNTGELQKIDFTKPEYAWMALPSAPEKKVNLDPIENNYDTLAGDIDYKTPGLVLCVDSHNQASNTTLSQLGFSDDERDTIDFDDIMNKEVKIILNDTYYTQVAQYFAANQDLASMYNNENNISLKVQAIVRMKKEKEAMAHQTGLFYTPALTQEILNKNQDSVIVKTQKNSAFNVLTGAAFDEASQNNTKDNMLRYLGAQMVPSSISIYPNDFDAKDKVLDHLDAYNEGKSEEDVIRYTDMAQLISALSGNIMAAITLVLIAFSAISLIVSSIMIGIITYTSVLERTKEIGILRALGARKKDITRVFNAETMIIGICSGLLGIGIASALCFPINRIIEDMSGLANVAKLNPMHAIVLIVVSMSLTFIGGLLPAKIAAKKDPVEALRSE